MELASVLGPWILLLLLALPLIYVEKLLHQHMYGVGYLLTKDEESATRFYYLLFFPGIFLHEFIQYLTAGLLNIKIKSIKMRPKKQNNGTLRFDFVTIDKRNTETWQAAIMGGVPFIIAATLVWTISNTVLELTAVPAAFSTGDIRDIGEAFGGLRDTPDFWLWMYLLFTISNGMLPTKEDREGWYLILVGLGGLSIFFFVIGLQSVIIDTLTGPITESLNLVNTALFIILSIDIGVVLMLGLVEDTIERITGEKMDYSGSSGSTSSREAKRQPGSNLPVPKGELLPSVYNITLPLPNLPKRGQMPVPRPSVTAADEEAKPAGAPTPPLRETPALSRAEPQTEHVPDPDAAARAQMDPRVPRTSGDSPFRRSTLTADEEEKKDEKPAAERTPSGSQRFGQRKPDDKQEEKPSASSRFGSRRDTSDDKAKEDEKPRSSRFGRRHDEAAEEKPKSASSRFGRKRDEDKEEEKAKPASSRFSRRDRDEVKSEDEAKASPFARRKPDSKEADKPRSSRYDRKRDDTDTPEDEQAKPASSRFSRRDRDEVKSEDEAKASPFARRTPDSKQDDKPRSSRIDRKRDDIDTAEDEKKAKPASSRFSRRDRDEEKPKDEAQASPFARRTPDSKQDDKPRSSRFDRKRDDTAEDEKTAKPASSRRDRDEEKSKDEAKASPFARRTPDSKQDDKPRSSRFDRRRDDTAEDEKKAKPASSRFPRGDRDEEKSEATPTPDIEAEDEKPATSRFGRRLQQSKAFTEETQQFEPTKRMKASDLSDDEDEAPARPARPSGQFNRQDRPSPFAGRRRGTGPLPKPSAKDEDEPPDDESGGDDDVEYVDFDDV